MWLVRKETGGKKMKRCFSDYSRPREERGLVFPSLNRTGQRADHKRRGRQGSECGLLATSEGKKLLSAFVANQAFPSAERKVREKKETINRE